MKNTNLEEFKQKLLELCGNDSIDMLYISDDWTMGYTRCCEKCCYMSMELTDLKIPFSTEGELQDFLDELSIDFELCSDAHWLYDDSNILCHCGEDGYILTKDGIWKYDDEFCNN